MQVKDKEAIYKSILRGEEPVRIHYHIEIIISKQSYMIQGLPW